LLQDYRHFEDAIGARLQRPGVWWVQRVPQRLHGWLYRFALERGYLDTLLTTFVVTPFIRLFRWFDWLERQWTDFLGGHRPADVPAVAPKAESTAEFARTYR
jgi:NAD(P)H-quinone oxidoreductase subunit 5